MTREQIEKAARMEMSSYYADEEYPCDIKDIQSDFIEAFSKGAAWRINSVWHDKSERPEIDRKILTYFGTKCFEIDFLCKEDFDWEYYADKSGIVRWAYIDDLLPERKEAAR